MIKFERDEGKVQINKFLENKINWMPKDVINLLEKIS